MSGVKMSPELLNFTYEFKSKDILGKKTTNAHIHGAGSGTEFGVFLSKMIHSKIVDSRQTQQ